MDPLKFKKIESEVIDWEEDAVPMIQKYRDHTGDTPTSGGKKLNGLMIDTADLRKIIGEEGSGVEKVFLMFAIKETDDGQQDFTTVLTGVDSDDKIITSPAIDYCEPCPDACADDYTYFPYPS